MFFYINKERKVLGFLYFNFVFVIKYLFDECDGD